MSAPTRHGMTRSELLRLPVATDLKTSARALGIGSTKAYELVQRGEFPVPVRRVGRAYRVATADLLAQLGITASADTDHPTELDTNVSADTA